MKNFFFIFVVAILQGFSLTAQAGLSAARNPNQDFTVLVEQHFSAQPQSSFGNSLPQEEIVEWESLEQLQEFFEATRDERFLEKDSDFPRRISWPYPDDGCFARAALVIEKAKEKGLPLPNRVFIYGNLKASTPHAPQKFVTWWYHTAPIVQVNGEKYVLDAALDPENPLPLKEWIDLQTDSPRDVKICQPYTYDPRHSCTNSALDTAPLAHEEILTYLDYEWRRQLQLDRVPSDILGENPPWKSVDKYVR